MNRCSIFFKSFEMYNFCKKKGITIIPIFFKIICILVNRSFCAGIPINQNIKKFNCPHGFNGIFISKQAKIAENCTIFQQVTIGFNDIKESKHYGAPSIGKNVYIGAGAKIIGNITIGNNVKIGANCIVTDDVEDNCTVVMEHPRIIKRSITNEK